MISNNWLFKLISDSIFSIKISLKLGNEKLPLTTAPEKENDFRNFQNFLLAQVM
jgi:hypothetical protein